MNPQLENGYLRLATDIQEAFCRFRIPGEVRQVIDAVIRLTYGWHKKESKISISQITKLTGLTRQHTWRALNTAIQHKVVAKVGYTLSLNKNHSEWISFKVYPILATNKSVANTDYKRSQGGLQNVANIDYTIYKDKKDKKDRVVPTQNFKHIDYLDTMGKNEAEVLYFKEKFPVFDNEFIIAQAEKCADWLRAKGMKTKDYRARFRNWLRSEVEFQKKKGDNTDREAPMFDNEFFDKSLFNKVKN